MHNSTSQLAFFKQVGHNLLFCLSGAFLRITTDTNSLQKNDKKAIFEHLKMFIYNFNWDKSKL